MDSFHLLPALVASTLRVAVIHARLAALDLRETAAVVAASELELAGPCRPTPGPARPRATGGWRIVQSRPPFPASAAPAQGSGYPHLGMAESRQVQIRLCIRPTVSCQGVHFVTELSDRIANHIAVQELHRDGPG